jgi:hypothetical protein
MASPILPSSTIPANDIESQIFLPSSVGTSVTSTPTSPFIDDDDIKTEAWLPNTNLEQLPWYGCAKEHSYGQPPSSLSLLQFYLHIERISAEPHHQHDTLHCGDIIIANNRLCYVCLLFICLYVLISIYQSP